MKDKLCKINISKIYILLVLLISVIILVGYFSYAMFTVSTEKKNAISIVTGNLEYTLTVDGTNTNILEVPANSTKVFTIVLTNPNSIKARYNFYYTGSLSSGVTAGYMTTNNVQIPPGATGTNLNSMSSFTYKISVTNQSSSAKSVTLGVQVGLSHNDLALPSDGHLFNKMKIGLVADVIEHYLGDSGTLNTSDSKQTFINGKHPNNYVWYSGKLWRIVSIDTSDRSTKLITQWNISAIPYNAANTTTFNGSHVYQWLNDTSVDGFLGNLRNYTNFIKTDSKWNATTNTTALGSITRLSETTMVTAAVGLLNIYEYQQSYKGGSTTYATGYLNNGLYWWTLTPYNSTSIRSVGNVNSYGADNTTVAYDPNGIRPVINLKSSVTIVGGSGTESDPYRLLGDNDAAPSVSSGTLLSSRYSGEYVRYGTNENNLYRIVSKENGGAKLTSANALKVNGSFLTKQYNTSSGNATYTPTSSAYAVSYWLNNDYLTNGAYLTTEQASWIDSSTWFLGNVNDGASYKLAKYSSTSMTSYTSSKVSAKVGLLRLGEQMSGQFDRGYVEETDNSSEAISTTGLTNRYWLITPYESAYVRTIFERGDAYYNGSENSYAIKPAVSLKTNVILSGGTGTKSNPFTLDSIDVLYNAQLQTYGWQGYVKNDASTGKTGYRLEGIKIKLDNPTSISGGLKYRAHVQSVGWQSYVTDDTLAGTTGEALRMEAIQISLTGNLANKFDIYYRAYVQDQGWQSYVKNGATAGTEGQSLAIQMIQIKLVAK